MFDSELKCPNCNHPITTKTKKCPNCKRSISKKLIKKYQNSISKFWGVFLGSYIFFLMFPFLLYEYIGYKWTGIIILAGIPISFLLSYIVKKISIKRQ